MKDRNDLRLIMKMFLMRSLEPEEQDKLYIKFIWLSIVCCILSLLLYLVAGLATFFAWIMYVVFLITIIIAIKFAIWRVQDIRRQINER